MTAVGLVTTACGNTDADTPAGDPPWCLVEAALPVDREDVEAVLDALPESIDGDARRLQISDERLEVLYDEPLEGMPSIQVISVDAVEVAFGQTFTAFELLEIMLEAGVEEVDPGGVYGEMDEVAMDPEADLVWATGWTIELDTRAPSMVFADPDGRWIYNILAASDASRFELVETFCNAIGG